MKGEDGLPLINRLFLTGKNTSFTDTYRAILALRFIHDQSAASIPEDQILESFRMVLDNKLMADIAVNELAHRKDWASTDRVVEVFKAATQDQQYIRISVVNFLRACPEAAAKMRLQELNELDPTAVKLAHTFATQKMIEKASRSKTRIRGRSRGYSVFRC